MIGYNNPHSLFYLFGMFFLLFNDLMNNTVARLQEVKKCIISEKERYKHPFDANGKLKKNYREDESIYSNCGDWESKSQRDINLIRVLFSLDFSDKFRCVRLVILTAESL